MTDKGDSIDKPPAQLSSPLPQGEPKYKAPHKRGKGTALSRPTTPPPRNQSPKLASPSQNMSRIYEGCRAFKDNNWRDRSKQNSGPATYGASSGTSNIASTVARVRSHANPTPLPVGQPGPSSFHPSPGPIFRSSVSSRIRSSVEMKTKENGTGDKLASSHESDTVVDSKNTSFTSDVATTTSMLKDLEISEVKKTSEDKASIEASEAILLPNIVYVFDFGFNGLFSTKISESDEKRYANPPDHYIGAQNDARVQKVINNRITATQIFWSQHSNNTTQQKWTDLSVGWQGILQELNGDIRGDTSRCMQDSDVPDLLQLLSVLTKQYSFYSSHDISCGIATSMLNSIGKMLTIFLVFDTDAERHGPFLYERWVIFESQKSTWIERFHANFPKASEEFRGIINASENTQLRNHYLPESGKWVNIRECQHGSGGSDLKISHRLLSPFVITMNGDICLAEDSSEFEYIWGGEHYYLKTPPITPPRKSSILADGIKLSEDFFDDNGNFCVPPSFFNVVNAKATAPKKRTNDEGVLILDFDFIKAMEQYARGFAEHVENLVRLMVHQDIDFNERDISAIADIFRKELKIRLRINPNDTFFGMESLDSHVVFEAFWGPTYTLYTTTRKRITLQSHQPRLASNLTQHLKVVYNDLHERGKITVEIGKLGKDDGGTLPQCISAAISTTAFSGLEGTRRHPEPDEYYSITGAPDEEPSDENITNEASTFINSRTHRNILVLGSMGKEDLEGSDEEDYERT
ncbi:hypothetical protein TWF694_011240 [Orbilia ellipsospora]|uniref:Uncharacterized protein n=1 Tax=Orbilia ellipsospora TaxID=2528407 RepID=A0AAV9X8F2_9PEZI